MAEELPRTIENPLNGERVTFLTTAGETGGEYVRTRTEIPAGAQGPPMHYHLAYTEAFEVLEGTLDVDVGGDGHVLLAKGESVHVPLGTAHRFWNSGAGPAVFEVEIRPARGFEKSIRAQFGLISDGRANGRGIPKNVLELALLYELSESYVVGMPLSVQRGIFGALAAVARWWGYDAEFTRYTEPGGAEVPRRPPGMTGPKTVWPR